MEIAIKLFCALRCLFFGRVVKTMNLNESIKSLSIMLGQIGCDFDHVWMVTQLLIQFMNILDNCFIQFYGINGNIINIAVDNSIVQLFQSMLDFKEYIWGSRKFVYFTKIWMSCLKCNIVSCNIKSLLLVIFS